MAKERLSKLQRWILIRCLKNGYIRRDEMREFFGKKFPMSMYRKKYFAKHLGYYVAVGGGVSRNIGKLSKSDFEIEGYHAMPKDELISTNTIEVVISNSLMNLLKKGLIEKFCYGLLIAYFLTKKGVIRIDKNNRFEDYKTKTDEIREGCYGFYETKKVLGFE